MGLYLLGGILTIKGLATVPALLTFMEYYTDFVNRLLGVSDIIMKWGEQEASIRKLNDLMEQEVKKPHYRMNQFKQVSIRNLNFQYEGEMQALLKEFNLDIMEGEKIGILGESGCGKSTLIKLMAGYLIPNAGEILFNGSKMEEIDRNDFYSKIGFLMQESALFNLSIRENLLFGKDNASEEELTDACKRANILEFVLSCKDGFDTIIGENGIRLSGGQRQRMLIARLFLQNPEMIVFDEATSALDYQNESEILNLLLKDCDKKKTLLMVTHRRTSLQRCDRIITM